MRSLLFIALAASLTVGCSRDRQAQEGLPPASAWKGASQDLPPAAPPPGMQGKNVEMDGSDPHAGLGIDPAGGGDPSDPHAGMNVGSSAGTDISKMMPAPDPNRVIDHTRYVKGTIAIHEKAKSRAKAGTSLFVVVKRVDASGAPTGTALAVDKLTWNDKELTYELTEQQAMVAGTELVGDVVVTVRYDQDSDALSKEAGDIVGSTRVKIPADNVRVVLDTVL